MLLVFDHLYNVHLCKTLLLLPNCNYSRLTITRTLANSNLALTRTKLDFPWISVIHSL